jgi:hypothetical protein
MATRGSCRLLVPVKTRNNTTSKGKTKKNSYRLYTKPGHYEAAQKIAAFAGAKIHWITVTVDAKAKTFSICMGDVAELSSPKRISMHPELHVPNYKRLAIDQPDDENFGSLDQRSGDGERLTASFRPDNLWRHDVAAGIVSRRHSR